MTFADFLHMHFSAFFGGGFVLALVALLIWWDLS